MSVSAADAVGIVGLVVAASLAAAAAIAAATTAITAAATAAITAATAAITTTAAAAAATATAPALRALSTLRGARKGAEVLRQQLLEAGVRVAAELRERRRLVGGHAEALDDLVGRRGAQVELRFSARADQRARRSRRDRARPTGVEQAVGVIGRIALRAVVLVRVELAVEVLVLAADIAREGARDELELGDRAERRVSRLVAEVAAFVELVLGAHHAGVVIGVAPVDDRVGDIGAHVGKLEQHQPRRGVDVDLRVLVLRAEEAHAVLDMADLPRAALHLAGRGEGEVLEHLARVLGVGALGVVLEDRDRLLDSRARSPARLDARDRLATHRGLAEREDLRRRDHHRRDGDRPDDDHDDGAAARRSRPGPMVLHAAHRRPPLAGLLPRLTPGPFT